MAGGAALRPPALLLWDFRRLSIRKKPEKLIVLSSSLPQCGRGAAVDSNGEMQPAAPKFHDIS